MTDEDGIGLSRRRVLAGITTVGVAGAMGGAGTMAFFSDEEEFTNNQLTAGSLDLKVDWEEHYSDWSADESEGLEYSVLMEEPGGGTDTEYVGFPDPDHPQIYLAEDDIPQFMANTSIEAFPDPDNDGRQEVRTEEFDYEPCDMGADTPEDLEPTNDDASRTNNDDTVTENGEPKPLIHLDDVKPGDFGELTLSFHLCDNPGYVWLTAGNISESENGINDPESEVDDSPDEAELAEQIKTLWWYDSRGDNVPQLGCKEKLYLTDSGTNPTTLYEVELIDNDDGSPDRAELTELWPGDDGGDDDFNQTDAIAATLDGDKVYFYDKESGHLGVYDVDADTFTDFGAVGGDPTGVVLAGFSPTGTLWAASQETDELYTVDPSDPSITAQGDTGIDLQGADIAFASDGTLYIWTAEEDDQGLYRVDDPATDTTAVPVDAGNIGNSDSTVTGLAIRDSGTGALVASDRKNNDIVIVDRTTGAIDERYRMTESTPSGVEEYKYDFGDMTVGALCGEVFRRGTLAEDLGALASGNGIPLDGNRASSFAELDSDATSDARECFVPGVNHYVGFAWYLPTDVGNEVQTDSVSFDLGVYAEQCRHNDGAGQASGDDGNDENGDEETITVTVEGFPSIDDAGNSLEGLDLTFDFDASGVTVTDLSIDGQSLSIGSVNAADGGQTLQLRSIGGNVSLSTDFPATVELSGVPTGLGTQTVGFVFEPDDDSAEDDTDGFST
jgi:predicted ribosomally synthesized peptide with SipW-like signal peptide